MKEQAPEASSRKLLKKAFSARDLIVYGGGGHGKSIIDLVRSEGSYTLAGIIDDGMEPGAEVMGLPVLGPGEILPLLVERGLRYAVNAVGGIGEIDTRVEVFQRILEAGLSCPMLTHPTAFVESSAKLSPGVQVLPQVYVGSQANIGFGVILNTGVIVSHDCRIGDFAGIAPGAMLAGEVQIGEKVQIGMGVTINLQVSVGSKALIGNSAVVKGDVPANTVVHAGEVWPPKKGSRSR
jgi:sugar O-acyltransferase (sialic acid O-acetyltransferase NeuD family)